MVCVDNSTLCSYCCLLCNTLRSSLSVLANAFEPSKLLSVWLSLRSLHLHAALLNTSSVPSLRRAGIPPCASKVNVG
eukprot:1116533-Pyramimonas_sp.AAC.1